MKSPRILLVSNGFQPNYEKAFANGLAEAGLAITLVTSDRTLHSELRPDISTVNLRGSQDSRRSYMQKACNLMLYVKRLISHIQKGQYDIVHLTGMFMTRNVLAGSLEWLGYRLLCTHFVMTVHNVLPHGRHGMWYRLNHHFIYRLPHLLVVHTQKMKLALVEGFGIDGNRIVVMAHGVDEVPAQLGTPTACSSFRVLLFGGLSHYKGVDQFLKAAALCTEIPMHIVIAGEARDASYATLISELIKALPPMHQIDWQRGFIPEEKVKDFFEAADVVVLPYRHIDQSGVLFTAFRFGAPLIATDVGSFREGLPSFCGVLASSSEPKELASALREFIERREDFSRSRIRAHAQSLCWSNTVRPLVSSYQGLCQ